MFGPSDSMGVGKFLCSSPLNDQVTCIVHLFINISDEALALIGRGAPPTRECLGVLNVVSVLVYLSIFSSKINLLLNPKTRENTAPLLTNPSPTVHVQLHI